ncbi:MAG TPA: 5'-nucleotidase C-terminal domain-containing protein [Pyrinomonadaceae bacterium]
MHPMFPVRAGFLSVLLVGFAPVAFSQPSPAESAASPAPLEIIYTGKLLGYFRSPSHQSSGSVKGCGGLPNSPDSDAATKFLTERKNHQNAILVATGDNFSPQLEARVFEPAPPKSAVAKPGDYVPGNKELYVWYHSTKAQPESPADNNTWVFYQKAVKIKELLNQIENGIATIPTDNVGCFLYQSRLTALVPGKHDFYFGAERVRQLARFMATLPKNQGSEPPQMLGANLVIKTAGLAAPPPLPKADESKWPEGYSIAGLREGKSVYPFASLVRVKIAGPENVNLKDEFDTWSKHATPTRSLFDSFVREKLSSGSTWQKFADEVKALGPSSESQALQTVYICPANASNQLLIADCNNAGWRAEDDSPHAGAIRLTATDVTYTIAIRPHPTSQPGKNGHYSTFEPGKSYGFCLHQGIFSKGVEKQCLRFSVFTPFFSFPHTVTSSGSNFIDPDPYVLLPSAQLENEVAIFGVVDPNLGERVGVLNFSWLNKDDNLKSVVSAEDPALALRQQLDYFAQKYKNEHQQKQFTGLKILLAQMSPQLARVLAARFPEFQVVVTEADDEQATPEISQQSTWSATSGKGTAFVAVPAKSFDEGSKSPRVSMGILEASITSTAADNSTPQTWLVSATPNPPVSASELLPAQNAAAGATTLTKRIDEALKRCASIDPKNVDPDHLKLLTLCAIREGTGADVALLQKRDFFDLKSDKADRQRYLDAIDRVQYQQTLDRILWKGDLLTLLYVPGSAIKKAMDQSKKFNNDDANILSLSDERNRGFEFLGITFDGEQYFINEMPLDDKKIYAVATTDYIGAGDTGYPDFKAAALNPKTIAQQFPQKLDVISGIVCRVLFQTKADADQFCLPRLHRDDYLDQTVAKRPASPKASNLVADIYDVLPFRIPPRDPASPSIQEVAQRRPIWTLGLRNFSFGFNGLSKNLTDSQVSQKFAGIPTSGVTARKTSTFTAQLDSRLSRSSHSNEFFVGLGADFKQQSTGDASPQIVQINNRVTSDAGLVHALRGGRSQTRVGLALYVHAEAPLQKPFSTFTLTAQDRLRITQDRNFLILPRLGLRWLNRGNSFEGGIQAGREINAFAGYSFNTRGTIVTCPPNSTETFAGCVNRLIKAGTVTKDSVASTIVDNRPRTGLYSRINLTIPLTSKAKYVFSEEGDYFFNFHGDNSIDTRLRDISKHSLKFNIWPSLSIGPTLQILLYKNKLNGDFLFQRQFGFETTLSFDLFNHREKMVQIKYKKP